jgi:hypothetical protein
MGFKQYAVEVGKYIGEGTVSLVSKFPRQVIFGALYKTIGEPCAKYTVDTLASLYVRSSAGLESVIESIDTYTGDSRLNSIGRTVFDYAGQGRKVVVERLESQIDGYDAYLEHKKDSSPGLVGFWDGFLHMYLGTTDTRCD